MAARGSAGSASQWFKRAERGLYGGKTIRFGNNVSHSERKTRRSWKPNVQYSTIRSDFLGHDVRMPVTTHVLRCIKKAGGFDHYLVKTKDQLLRNPDAIDLKNQIQAARRQGQYTLSTTPDPVTRPEEKQEASPAEHQDEVPETHSGTPKPLWDALSDQKT